MAAVPGYCRDIPSCFSCSSPLWGSWVGVSGLAVGPGDMQTVYSPHGMAADWATYSPRDVIGFRLPTPPGPVGAGGRGGANRPGVVTSLQAWLHSTLRATGDLLTRVNLMNAGLGCCFAVHHSLALFLPKLEKFDVTHISNWILIGEGNDVIL